MLESLFKIKLRAGGLQLYWGQTPVQGIPVNFCEILKNTSFKENLQATAYGDDPEEYLAFLGNSLQNVSFLTRRRHYIIFRDV